MSSSQQPLQIDHLRKVYQVSVRQPGIAAALRSLVHRETKDIAAVNDISFLVGPGEVVGLLGPNGAGKTTTLKMASGLLHPSGGSVRVLGYEPWKREHAFLRQITLVMGNRNQLEWDIPCHDSYDLLAAVFPAQVGCQENVTGPLEFPDHPFYVTSMFQPHVGASAGAPIHPLVVAFVTAVRG